MAANVIDFMTALIYGDMGTAELGVSAPALPPGQVNHLRWTLANTPNAAGTTVTGTAFLVHHLDEIKAPFSYRYWALMKWVSDLRSRLNFVTVLPVYPVYDKDGTVLTDKDFTDIFHQVHHVWHPNGVGTGWTTPTPWVSWASALPPTTIRSRPSRYPALPTRDTTGRGTS